MKIAICHSMQFAEKAREVEKWFAEKGHQARGSIFINGFLGLNDEEKEKLKLKQKYERDAIREHWKVIQWSDVVLILNYDKNGIINYIGGNTFLEMGFAYVLNKKIYLLNPVPKMPFYETELIALKPIIINNDLTKIK